MKKGFLLLVMMCLSFVLSAQVTYDGDIKVLKGTATYDVVFDYSALEIEDKPVAEYLQSRDDKFRNAWDSEIVPGSEQMGKIVPSQVNKNFTLATEPQYRFVIKLVGLKLGNAGQMFNPFSSTKAGGAVITGDMDIVDVASNEVVAVIHFNEIQGVSTFSDRDRWILAYSELVKKIKKVVKKAK